MPRRIFSGEPVVVHVGSEVRFEVKVLQPLLDREVVDSAALRPVGQISILVAFRTTCAVGVLVFRSLHAGVRGVPESDTHIHTHRDGLQGLQSVAF